MQVHIILGVRSHLSCENCPTIAPNGMEACPLSYGAMADVRASPNDPVFINHHAMIDLIFEMWLQQHPNASYGGPPINSKFPGHAAGDCAVPFISVYTHSQAFSTSENFGYYYTPLEAIDASPTASPTTEPSPTTTESSPPSTKVSLALVITGIMMALMTVLP